MENQYWYKYGDANGIDKVVDAFDINCEYQGDNCDEMERDNLWKREIR